MATTLTSAPVLGTATSAPPPGTSGRPDMALPGTPGESRVASLDVLRGLAIIGTLLTNIGLWVAITGSDPVWMQHLDTAVGLITDGKYIGLLTIMFGIGLEIQRQSAIRKGEPWLGAYPWRAALLILDGLLNYIFIFDFDVLMGYGLTGLTMCFVFATTERFQKWFLGFGIAVHLAFLAWMSRVWEWFDGSAGAGFPGGEMSDADLTLLEKAPDQLTPAQLEKVSNFWDVSPAEYTALWKRNTSGVVDPTDALTYWGQVERRVTDFWQGRGEIPIMFSMGLGMFLVGAFLYRRGVFEPAGRKLRLWVMAISFGVALPVDWGTRLYLSDYTVDFNRYFTSATVSVGILALVAHFYARGREPGWIGRPLSLVGKMALTCYLAQNLLALLLFAEYGPLELGQYWPKSWPGSLGMYAAWALISAILVGFSWVWLKFFSRGPIELLWHQSYDWVTTHVPTRWEPRVKRLDSLKQPATQATKQRDTNRVCLVEGSE